MMTNKTQPKNPAKSAKRKVVVKIKLAKTPVRKPTKRTPRIHRAEKIGSLVAAARKNAGISQAELARRIGWASKTSITHLETGRNEPRLSTIRAIATALDTPIENLIPA